MTAGGRRSRSDPPRGQALVEFALVVPLFLVLLFGLIELGRFIYLSNAFNEAAREAARFGSVEQWEYACPGSVGSPDRFTCSAQVARDRVAGAPAAFDVEVTCSVMGNNEVTEVSAAECGTDDLLVVTVSTPPSGPNAFRFLTPVIGQLIGNLVVSGQAQVVVQ